MLPKRQVKELANHVFMLIPLILIYSRKSRHGTHTHTYSTNISQCLFLYIVTNQIRLLCVNKTHLI